MWILVFFAKDYLSALVLGAESSKAAEFSSQSLTILSCFFCLYGALMVVHNTMQGMGCSFQAVLSGLRELAGRAIGSLFALRLLGFAGICLANLLTWLFALIYCSIPLAKYLKKRLTCEHSFHLKPNLLNRHPFNSI